MLAIDPDLFADVQGSTDTEVVFNLALTFGLEDDPIDALERTVGLIEAPPPRHGVDDAGAGHVRRLRRRPRCGRCATRPRPGALAVRLADAEPIRRLHPDNARLARCSPDDRLIVSEPFADLPGSGRRSPSRRR